MASLTTTGNDTAVRAWASYWQSKPIPILEASLRDLAQLARRADRVRPVEIADVVLRDPLFTLQVLRHINQRNRTQLGAEIVSVEKTVMLMGVVPFLERFVRLTAVEKLLSNPEDSALLYRLVAWSRFFVRITRDFANQRYDARMDEILVAALLHNINDLLMLLSRQDKAAPPMAGHVSDLLLSLQMPDAVPRLLNVGEDAAPREVMQQALCQMSIALQTGWWWPDVQQCLRRIADVLGVETGQVWQNICRHILEFARQEQANQRVFLPARWLPMQPGEWARPNPIAAKTVEPTPATVAVDAGAIAKQKKIRQDALAKHMQALHLAGINGSPGNQIMALAIQALSDGMAMRRIWFATYNAGGEILKVRFTFGISKESPLNNLEFRLNEKPLLQQLMQKPQGVWVQADPPGRFDQLLPTGFKSYLNSEPYCLMSICAGVRPIGLIYADRYGADPITDHHYQHFKQICLLTCRALASQSTPKTS